MNKISIAEYIVRFKKTKNPYYLIKAMILIVRQGKIDEVLFGIYCQFFFKPSKVLMRTDEETEECKTMARAAIDLYKKRRFLNRNQLIEYFGEKFNVSALPLDFEGCRAESIVEVDNLLILGDYGRVNDSATIAIISKDRCTLNNFYNQLRGVRHIHSIHLFNESEILISTGDTKKLTDLWTIEKDINIKFKKRLKKYLAGYTAVIKVNNQFFFGTDFSGRPNFIETLEGDRYFFPSKAYKMWVEAFYAFSGRYFVSINTELIHEGNRKTLSIFDTVNKQFIFCEYFC